MIRLLGCVLTILSTSALGFMAAANLCRRVRELEWFSAFLVAMREELQYSMAAVEELIRAVSQREELRRLPLLAEFLRRSSEGGSFPTCWRQAVEAVSWGIGEEDKTMIASLSEVLGAYDSASQTEALMVLEKRTQLRLGEARAYRDKHVRLCHTLGALSGIGICILFQ